MLHSSTQPVTNKKTKTLRRSIYFMVILKYIWKNSMGEEIFSGTSGLNSNNCPGGRGLHYTVPSDGMWRVWVRRGGCIGSWWGNRREGDHWGDLGVDGWIILGWISRRWDVGIWTVLGWSRIEKSGGRL